MYMVIGCKWVALQGSAWQADLGSFARTHVSKILPDTGTGNATDQTSLESPANEGSPVHTLNSGGSLGTRACDTCFKAKTGCNQKTPCVRCKTRGFDCNRTIPTVARAQKSCNRCNQSKTQCDQKQPSCTRCSTRQPPLDCEYPSSQPGPSTNLSVVPTWC